VLTTMSTTARNAMVVAWLSSRTARYRVAGPSGRRTGSATMRHFPPPLVEPTVCGVSSSAGSAGSTGGGCRASGLEKSSSVSPPGST
jgi:hypothetical protein